MIQKIRPELERLGIDLSVDSRDRSDRLFQLSDLARDRRLELAQMGMKTIFATAEPVSAADAIADETESEIFQLLAPTLELVHDMISEDRYTEKLLDLMAVLYTALEKLGISLPATDEHADKGPLLQRLSELSSLAHGGDLEGARRR